MRKSSLLKSKIEERARQFQGKLLLIYPDERVLVAIVNNQEDWRRVQDERWYRCPSSTRRLIPPILIGLPFIFAGFQEKQMGNPFLCPHPHTLEFYRSNY